MPTADLSELIAKLEGATGPSEELDARLWCVVRGREFFVHPGFGDRVPAYTASIDAALTLVPSDTDARVYRPTIWTGRAVGGFFGPSARIAMLAKDDGAEDGWAVASAPGNKWEHRGATPAIALCIAALKARASMESDR